jgi:hypothetical protein
MLKTDVQRNSIGLFSAIIELYLSDIINYPHPTHHKNTTRNTLCFMK